MVLLIASTARQPTYHIVIVSVRTSGGARQIDEVLCLLKAILVRSRCEDFLACQHNIAVRVPHQLGASVPPLVKQMI